MKPEENVNVSQFVKIIFEAQRRMQDARSAYWEHRASGGISSDVEQYLHASLMQYYDALRRYRDEKRIREEWEEYGMDEVEDVAFGVDYDRAKNPGRGQSDNARPRPSRFTAERAVKMSYRLDDLSKELGFAAPVRMVEADLDEAVV